jgi:hypothetical protein
MIPRFARRESQLTTDHRRGDVADRMVGGERVRPNKVTASPTLTDAASSPLP